MNTTITKYLALMVLLITPSIKMFAQNDHLEPARDFSSYEGILKGYYDSVFPLLYKGFSEVPYAKYTVMPSFSKEYAMSLEEKLDGCYLLSNTLSESYWYARRRKGVKVKSTSLKIKVELYQLAGELFSLATHQIKERGDMMGLDGVTYYFSTTDGNGKSIVGETWSPENGTLMERLVKVCDDLYSLSIGNKLSETKIEEEVRLLVEDMRK